MINSEIDHLVRLISKLPGLGLRSARRIVFKDSIYELRDYVKRTVLENKDIIEKFDSQNCIN